MNEATDRKNEPAGNQAPAFPSGMRIEHSEDVSRRMKVTMPGGDTRASVYYTPFPLTMARGSGCRMWDVDGNEYIDLLNNFTSLIHGHARSELTEALSTQASHGTVFGAPAESQLKLSSLLCERVDSVDLVRFTNSGTEAVMMAVRAARAHTGRSSLIKLDGGYHGSWEQVPMEIRGEGSLGTPDQVLSMVRSVPLNDAEALARAVDEVGDDLAAIILEPVMGEGVLAAEPGFLEATRRAADRTGAVLIFDEVISFRLGLGGYQGEVGVKPDLTTFGKIIGGGMPVGAFGGKEEIMNAFDPRNGMLQHAGTYNGNAMTMGAGSLALELYDETEFHRIGEMGRHLATELDRMLEESTLDGRATGNGSLAHVHFGTGGEVPQQFADLHLESPDLVGFHRAALAEGVFIATRGLMCVSTAMSDDDLEEVLGRLGRAIERLEHELSEN